MQPTVLLFDIDGTLLTTGGAGLRAMQRGFAAVHRGHDAFDFRLDGMTDWRIVRQALAAIGKNPTEQAIDEVLSAYLEVLRDEVMRVPDHLYRVHVGMREALAACRERGAAVGLGTGNVHEGARVKLERAGLFDRFAFGGFGSDAEDRTELIRIGAERGAAALGFARAACRVVVIGDTPKDVAAAHGIGAECIAVATGNYTCSDLLASGADKAFLNLAAEGALGALLG